MDAIYTSNISPSGDIVVRTRANGDPARVYADRYVRNVEFNHLPVFGGRGAVALGAQLIGWLGLTALPFLPAHGTGNLIAGIDGVVFGLMVFISLIALQHYARRGLRYLRTVRRVRASVVVFEAPEVDATPTDATPDEAFALGAYRFRALRQERTFIVTHI